MSGGIRLKKRALCLVLLLCILGTLLPPLRTEVSAFSKSDWIEASKLPEGAEVTDRKWTYTKTTYKDSKSSTMSGYTLVSTNWVQSGTGSKNYATFPSGFDTDHSIYTSFAKSALTSYENADTKRVVTSNSWSGYVYWHWMYDCGTTSGSANRAIYNKKGYGPDNGFYYKYFGAFTSSKGNYSSDKYYCNSQNITNYIVTDRTGYSNTQGALRWFRFDYYTSYYTDYYKNYRFQKIENLESATELSTASSATEVISNVKEMVRYKNSFTITYDANGGENAPASQTKKLGETMKLTTDKPTKTGCEFLGWSTASGSLGASYAPGDDFTSDGDYTLYAVWESRPRYTVTYDYKTNGGDSVSDAHLTAYEGDKANLDVTAVKEGWSFEGWSTDPNDKLLLGFEAPVVNEDLTLYAIFSKQITATYKKFVQPSEVNFGNMETLYHDSDVMSVELPAIRAMDGWTPVGWTLNGQPVTESTMDLTESAVFYAKYKKDVTLHYDANGGESAPADQTVTVYYTMDGTYENEVQPVLGTDAARHNYSLDKWRVGSADEGELYSAGDNILVKEDTTVYAQWTQLPPARQPTFSVQNVLNGKEITVSCTDPECDIYYTLDASSPSPQSAKYTGPFVISKSGTTVKAIACREGCADSAVAVQSVDLFTCSPVKIDVEPGILKSGTKITLSCDQSESVIKYTTDGSEPTMGSAAYTEPLVMEETFVLRTVAYCAGYAPNQSEPREYILFPTYTASTYGYSFGNTASAFGYTNTAPSLLNYCIKNKSVKLIFGNNVKQKEIYAFLCGSYWCGNCCGMASTSSLMFSPADPITAGDFGGQSVYTLGTGNTAPAYDGINVQTFIEAMQVSQYTSQFSREYSKNRRYGSGDLGSLFGPVTADIVEGKNDIIVVGQNGVGAHALLAYAYETVSDTESRLYVYDCNWPGDGNRYITFTKTAGVFTDWSYNMGFSYGVWSTAEQGEEIYLSYVPFDTVEYIWRNRGHLYDDNVALTVDSDNVAIYNQDSELLCEFVGGKFVTYDEDVYVVPDLKLDSFSFGEKNDNMIYMPEDFYVVENKSGGSFTASIVGNDLGSSVTTNSGMIGFGLVEATQMNTVAIEQHGSDTQYSVTLQSGYIGTEGRKVSLEGSTSSDGMMISMRGSDVSASNIASIGSYKIDDVEQIKYNIQASAGKGGTISPVGSAEYDAGSSPSFTATPNLGYAVDYLEIDGNPCVDFTAAPDGTVTYTFNNVKEKHTIKAYFKQAYAFYEELSLEGNSVEVGVFNTKKVNVAAVLYDGDTGRMVEAQTVTVKARMNNYDYITVTFTEDIPAHYDIRVMMIPATGDPEPLCKSVVLQNRE